MKDWRGLLQEQVNKKRAVEAEALAKEQAKKEARAKGELDSAIRMRLHCRLSIAAWSLYWVPRDSKFRTLEQIHPECFEATMEAVVNGWPEDERHRRLLFHRRDKYAWGFPYSLWDEAAAFILLNWDMYEIYDYSLEKAAKIAGFDAITRLLRESVKEEVNDD